MQNSALLCLGSMVKQCFTVRVFQIQLRAIMRWITRDCLRIARRESKRSSPEFQQVYSNQIAILSDPRWIGCTKSIFVVFDGH